MLSLRVNSVRRLHFTMARGICCEVCAFTLGLPKKTGLNLDTFGCFIRYSVAFVNYPLDFGLPMMYAGVYV